MRHRAVFASVFAALLALTASGSAEELVKHSRSIVAIADDARTFVLAEVAPGRSGTAPP